MDDWPSITPIIMITRVQYFFFCLLSYRFWYQDPGGGGPPSQSQKPQKRTETFKSKAEMIFLVRLVRQSSRWLSILLFLGGGGLADLWESLTSLFIYMCLMCCVCDYSTHTKSFFFFAPIGHFGFLRMEIFIFVQDPKRQMAELYTGPPI
jgi:hypothetical protein